MADTGQRSLSCCCSKCARGGAHEYHWRETAPQPPGCTSDVGGRCAHVVLSLCSNCNNLEVESEILVNYAIVPNDEHSKLRITHSSFRPSRGAKQSQIEQAPGMYVWSSTPQASRSIIEATAGFGFCHYRNGKSSFHLYCLLPS